MHFANELRLTETSTRRLIDRVRDAGAVYSTIESSSFDSLGGGRVIEGRVVIRVDADAIRREARLAGRSLGAAPAVRVLTLERFEDASGKELAKTLSAARLLTEQRLRDRGFRVVSDQAEAAVVVKVRATVRHTGSNFFGHGEHQSTVHIAVRIERRPSGVVVASTQKRGHGPATCFDENLLYGCALAHVAPGVLDETLAAVVAAATDN